MQVATQLANKTSHFEEANFLKNDAIITPINERENCGLEKTELHFATFLTKHDKESQVFFRNFIKKYCVSQ